MTSDHSSPNTPEWFMLYGVIIYAAFSVLSYSCIIVTSLLILLLARRSGSRHEEPLRWEGVMTVLLTVVVLLLSHLPWGVVVVRWFLGVENTPTTLRAAIHLTFLNVMANFFIYSLSVRSFRHFLKTKTSALLISMGLSRHERQGPVQRQRPPQRPLPQESRATTRV